MPPITNADLKKSRVVSRHYRNRRIGDFLKEMHMTEGRSTGFPKIYQAVKRNDSPMPFFETDDRNMHFLATMPIHQAFVDERAYLATKGKVLDEENKEDFLKDCTKNDTKDDTKKLSDRQNLIIRLIANKDTITIDEMIQKIKVSSITVKRDLADLQAKGILTREGGRKEGRWVIIKK